MTRRTLASCASFLFLWFGTVSAKPVHHYVFFGQDRGKIREASSFLDTKALQGAQIAYSWRQLEPEKDKYDFSAVREDLEFLTSHGKKLFLQLQDVSFSESRINVPRYLLQEAQYNGGADKQYRWKDGDEEHAVVAGWAARRWDPAVQERLHKLLNALGKEFDGRIEGINFAESSVGFGESGRLFPQGFSFEIYRDAIIANMKALKRAFPRSVAMQYANFMPGEWRPMEDKGYLRAVYEAAKQANVGVGGPDLLPHRPGQLKSSYPLIREAAGSIPTGIAVQDGNLEEVNPTTGKRVEISELIKFATEYLQVDYVFWGTQEPYYSQDVVPFLRRVGRNGPRSIGTSDWRVTGGDPGNSRYSPLHQINRANVAALRVAWIYHTGDARADGRSEIQATSVVVDGVLYATTPALAVVALRADSGTLIWRFDPFANRERESHVNRGVVYWSDSSERRIFFSAGRRLYALDATTGRPAPNFGDSGWVDLAAGLGRDIGDAFIVATSPGVVYQDLLIQGTRVGEDEGSAPGDIRAYDVRTGKIRWTFHTIPRPGEFGYDTWPAEAWKSAGGANSWAGMSVDVARSIVYIPTGSATPDFYGGNRIGANLFANTLLALDAATGKRLWHFQTVHHDLWDRDLPAAPNLVRVTRGGRRVDAVAQITKSGFVFLFDRESGNPLFPVEERAVPASDLNGEQAWSTQPFPLAPAPFARQSISEADLTELTPSARAAAVRRFQTLRHDALFAPPSRQGTVILPGFDGGGEWGGAAVDRETGVIYVNGSDVPWVAAMREAGKMAPSTGPSRTGQEVYAAACAKCHGADRRGNDRTPSLLGVGTRLSSEQLHQVIDRGRGFMPSFANLREDEKQAVIAYLLGRAAPAATKQPAENPRNAAQLAASRLKRTSAPYEFVGYERWRDSTGYPAVKPPWGTLSAIDLNTGDYRWRIVLGEHAALTAKGVPVTGTEQYGGPIVTAGGLVFIAATMDEKFRAFDKVTGKLLWQTALPAAGYATPNTYSVRGKQYVVIAAGGGKLGTKSGDAYVAFALP